MKVKELIEVLNTYNLDLEVISNGSQGGYNSVERHGIIEICVNYYKDDSWMGDHEYASFINEHWDGERKEALWIG